MRQEGKELKHCKAATFPIRSQHKISSARRETSSEVSEATVVPVPGPSNGPSNHNCFQAGNHKLPLSHLNVTEHLGNKISA